MKCPEKYKTIQENLHKTIIDDDDKVIGEYHLLVETQQFGNCYKEECVTWDKEHCCCRKISNEK